METVKCIMKPGDWIFKQTIREFTSEQWETFRVYLKSFGYRISNAYGKVTVDYDTVAVKELVGIMLDSQDLKWIADMPANGKIIDKHTILAAINTVTNNAGDGDVDDEYVGDGDVDDEYVGDGDKNQQYSELKQLEDKISALYAALGELEKQYEEVKSKNQKSISLTAVAIQLIGTAMSHPYTPINFGDYAGNKHSSVEICERIQESIKKLGIINTFHVDNSKQMLFYRLED